MIMIDSCGTVYRHAPVVKNKTAHIVGVRAYMFTTDMFKHVQMAKSTLAVYVSLSVYVYNTYKQA